MYCYKRNPNRETLRKSSLQTNLPQVQIKLQPEEYGARNQANMQKLRFAFTKVINFISTLNLAIILGFDTKDLFVKFYNNFEGNNVTIVTPVEMSLFAMIWKYPNGKQSRSGADTYTAYYLEQALKFKLRSKML